MTIDETALAPEPSVVEASPDLYSEGWWQSRTSDELRTIINRGFAQGSAFQRATAETERRAREHRRTEEDAADAQAVHNKRLRRLILEGLLLASLVAMIAAVLVR